MKLCSGPLRPACQHQVFGRDEGECVATGHCLRAVTSMGRCEARVNPVHLLWETDAGGRVAGVVQGGVLCCCVLCCPALLRTLVWAELRHGRHAQGVTSTLHWQAPKETAPQNTFANSGRGLRSAVPRRRTSCWN